MRFRLSLPALPFLATLAACHGGHSADVPGNREDHAPFHAISPDETVHFTGTEPFWSGEVTRSRLIYVTPDDQQGKTVTVSRFAGRGGLSFSGELGGKPLTLAVTPAGCSDGMSDRKYPFAVTLRLGEEVRQGCGWTERQLPTGPA